MDGTNINRVECREFPDSSLKETLSRTNINRVECRDSMSHINKVWVIVLI